MQHLELTEDELRETFQRAREIGSYSQAVAPAEVDLEPYLKAGEEMGIPREAMIHALRERSFVPGAAFSAGQMVFARSADGHSYPATVLTAGEHTAEVRFVGGGEHTCALADLRPLSLIPGRKIDADLKGWGWGKAVVERFDAGSGKVYVRHDDWSGTKETVKLEKVRLRPELTPTAKGEQAVEARIRTALTRCALLAGGAGLALGLLLDRLLPILLPFLR